MSRFKASTIGILAILLAIAISGCSGGHDYNPNAGVPGDPFTPPTVTFVTPPDGSTLICPNTAVVTATFSKGMNPATINASTFTLTSGGASVAGQVTYVAATNIALFTPASPLAQSAPYTATITTGAADIYGNRLEANKVWTFTTSVTCQAASSPLPPPGPPTPGALCNFAILAGSTVTSTGPTIITGGDLGLSPGTAVTGFPPGILTPPAVMHITDTTAATGQLNLTAAFIAAAGTPGGASLPGNLSGLTFAPGVYKNSSSVELTAGNVTLDAQGNADAVFIFQISSTLTTIGSTKVILAGGAQAKNIYWQVGTSATLGTNSTFEGTIMAGASITLQTGAILNGRAAAPLAVSLDSNVINVPPCQ